MLLQIKHLRGRAVKSMYITFVLQGVLGSILSNIIFFLFSRFSLTSQSASLYIIASFEVYLIDENKYLSFCFRNLPLSSIYLRQAYLTFLYCIP